MSVVGSGSFSRTLPYGEQQGSFHGVVACSNRDDGFFSGENNYVNSLIYTGYRYQCVEYARRYLLLTTGCIFGNCGRASEIYKMNTITHVETGAEYPLLHHDNDGTSKTRPEPGDIIIYPYHKELTPWGHVGVISYVDDKRVGIAEQNQFFGPFVSPSESYLDGERCVARYADLLYDAEAQTWRIQDASTMPAAYGWLSYPDAPRRDQIYTPFQPLPSVLRARATPLHADDHPFLKDYILQSGFEIPSGQVKHIYGMAGGSAETLVGATTATARVIRFTLQFLFDRRNLGSAFLSLPTNPFGAAPKWDDVPAEEGIELESVARLRSFFDAVATDEVLASADPTSPALLEAMQTYFEVPMEWLQAMAREFQAAEVHLAADVAFYPNGVCKEDKEEAARLKREARKESEAPVSVAAAVEESEGSPSDPCSPVTMPTAVEHPFKNPHDEAWSVGRVNFHTTRLLTELVQITSLSQEVSDMVHFVDPDRRAFQSTQYRVDFSRYLKAVEEQRGARAAFTVVVDSIAEHDGLARELISILQDCCERVKYPVRVVSIRDLFFSEEDGKLMAHPSAASPPASSPTTTDTPSGCFEVNFVYSFVEWDAILMEKDGQGQPKHAALYKAAMHDASDVVFAKPLWTYLCSGMVNKVTDDCSSRCDKACACARSSAAKAPGSEAPASAPVHHRFYDLCRHLYHLASPKQPPENWDMEVSEFKDSCRRIRIDAPYVPRIPCMGMTGNAAMLNFATSCFMAHENVVMEDRDHHGHPNGNPAALAFLFPAD